MKRTLIFGAVFLAGCASSGVVPLGQDSYMVSRRGSGAWTSSSELKAMVFQEANDYCAKQGKKTQVIDSHQEGPGLGHLPEADVQFKCVSN